MFQSLRRIFFRVRLISGAIRNGIMGIAVVLGAWIFLAPPSSMERAVLPLTAPDTPFQEVLWLHRGAKVLEVVLNDRMVDLIIARSGGAISSEELKAGVEIAASGQFFAGHPPPATEDQPTPRNRMIAGGAKSVRVGE